MISNGMTKKTIKNTVIGFLTVGLLTLFVTVGQSGLKGMVQQVAKEAVEDTVGENQDKIAKLQKLVESNIKEDERIHPQIAHLKKQLENAEKDMDQLRTDMRELSKKIDSLTNLLIEYMKGH